MSQNDRHEKSDTNAYDNEPAQAPVSGVFRMQPQPSVIDRIDALTARMRSAVSLLTENRPRDGRDD